MSSLRNAVQRRQHRERAQPAAREKWGLLEKHKDYSLRAADYNLKKAKLQRLREKASERNPDEFAFGMMSSGSNNQGRHGARDNDASSLSMETAKLLKTQDAGYLRVAGERLRRQLEQAEQDVKLHDGMQKALGKKKAPKTTDEDDIDREDDVALAKIGRKIVFVESVEEQQGYVDGIHEKSEKKKSEASSQPQVSGQRKSKKQLEAEEKQRKDAQAAKRLRKKAAESRLRTVEALKKQYQDIVSAERELDMQRARMQKSVGGLNKYGVKWKVRERKR